MEDEENIVVESSARLRSLADVEPPFPRVGRDITNLLNHSKKPFVKTTYSTQIY